MTASFDHQRFAWLRVRDLFGVPLDDPRVQHLFVRAGLKPDELLREVRVGIESMPPHDKAPCTMAEIDLSPTFRVRVRFKHARMVRGAAPGSAPDAFVLAGIAYFLDTNEGLQPFSAGLPQAIRPTDDIPGVIGRVGVSPTDGDYADQDETVYAIWEDRNPILHVLFGGEDKRPLKVTVFLAAADDDDDDDDD